MSGGYAGLAPWRMWGSNHTMLSGPVVSTLALSAAKYHATPQLVSVEYGRPDTFEFLLAFEVLAAVDSATPLVLAANILAYFEITLGVGRSSFTLNTPLFTLASGFPLTPAGVTRRYCTQFYAPAINGILAAADPDNPQLQNIVDHFTTDNVRVIGNVLAHAADPGPEQYQVNFTAFFAPRTHVRPEWHEGQFRGAEDQGQ